MGHKGKQKYLEQDTGKKIYRKDKRGDSKTNSEFLEGWYVGRSIGSNDRVFC